MLAAPGESWNGARPTPFSTTGIAEGRSRTKVAANFFFKEEKNKDPTTLPHSPAEIATRTQHVDWTYGRGTVAIDGCDAAAPKKNRIATPRKVIVTIGYYCLQLDRTRFKKEEERGAKTKLSLGGRLLNNRAVLLFPVSLSPQEKPH